MASDRIRVIGARVHNLKNINVEIPLNTMTVVSGVSGSGKSSLAFDTIYAEGQRRYVESLSAYARQFLERMEKPDVDAIEGIAPAVAIRQKAGSQNPRSTVATATEIYDYLRVLFARAGTTICPDCNLPVERDPVDTVVTRLLDSAAGRRVLVLFPVLPLVLSEVGASEAGASKELEAPPARKRGRARVQPAASEAGPVTERDALIARFSDLRARGFTRLYQAQGDSWRIVEFSSPETLLELDLSRPVQAVADRNVIEADARERLADAVEIAYQEAGEVSFVFPPAEGEKPLPTMRFSQRFECRNCGRKFGEPEPPMFSFNNPYGACPTCQGFGNMADFDPNLIVPDPTLSLNDGAIDPFTKPRLRGWLTKMRRYAENVGISLNTPWAELSELDRNRIFNGDKGFPGVRGLFRRLERKRYKVHVRVFLARYRGYTQCTSCGGARLRPEALWVRLRSASSGEWRNISHVTAMTVEQAAAFFSGLELSQQQRAVASAVLVEIQRRLGFLLKVGLEYLTLDRRAGTLSGGEAQRIQLAACLGSQLVGSLYVLDEPSIGLHPHDTGRLIGILHELRDLGNTILVVEHDPDVIRAGDYLIDMGPAAGERGGEVVAQGPLKRIAASGTSLTGRYLRGELRLPLPSKRRVPGKRRLRIEGAYAHNLRSVDVEFPLEMLVVVTGVSGSGKSTLVHDVLHRNLQAAMRRKGSDEPEYPLVAEGDESGMEGGESGPTGCRRILGAEHLDAVVMVDQSPIGRTPRSNPVTYIKAFDGIRELYAQLPEAKKRGYRAGHFSFNVPGGRCEDCQGDGVTTVDMQFLADVTLVCEECGGTRFQGSILEVRREGKNIHDVLRMTVSEAIAFFAGLQRILRPLKLLEEVGLGYLRLGQSASTLSGGEAQRLKLAAHLSQPRSAARTLFLLDEPTTGLHFDDIAKLLAALQRLLAAGGSVVVIEHNLEVIKAADWIVDLGPEAGERGGRVVAVGAPETVASASGSLTAPFLAKALRAG